MPIAFDMSMRYGSYGGGLLFPPGGCLPDPEEERARAGRRRRVLILILVTASALALCLHGYTVAAALGVIVGVVLTARVAARYVLGTG